MLFKCCLVIWKIAGTLDDHFNNFQHFTIYVPEFLHLLLIIIVLIWKGYGKTEMQRICKNYWRIFKISIPSADLKAPFSYAITGYGPKKLLSGCHQPRIYKSRADANIKTAFLVMALHQKLSRPSFKGYVNNISLCQAYFLKLKIPWLKIFFFRLQSHKNAGRLPLSKLSI